LEDCPPSVNDRTRRLLLRHNRSDQLHLLPAQRLDVGGDHNLADIERELFSQATCDVGNCSYRTRVWRGSLDPALRTKRYRNKGYRHDVS